MKQRILGKDLAVSALGLGCMGFSHAYGAPMDRSEAVRLLHQAADTDRSSAKVSRWQTMSSGVGW